MNHEKYPYLRLIKLQQISKKQKAEVMAVQRVEKRNQRDIERRLDKEQRKLKVDPYADPAREKIRTDRAEKEIKALEDKLKASYKREDEALGVAVPRRMTPAEENAYMDALLVETRGDVPAAMRLMAERGGR